MERNEYSKVGVPEQDINNVEQEPINQVQERGIRLVAGVEYLDDTKPVDPTALKTSLRKIADGGAVDPDITNAIGKVSTNERANEERYKGKPFETAYAEWQTGMTTWIQGIQELKTTNSELYYDNFFFLMNADIKISSFNSEPESVRSQLLDKLYNRYFNRDGRGETDVDAIKKDIFSTSKNSMAAGSDSVDAISVPRLTRKLRSLDSFLASCGATARTAIHDQFLAEGYLKGTDDDKNLFIETAIDSNKVTQHRTHEDPVLEAVLKAHNELAGNEAPDIQIDGVKTILSDKTDEANTNQAGKNQTRPLPVPPTTIDVFSSQNKQNEPEPAVSLEGDQAENISLVADAEGRSEKKPKKPKNQDAYLVDKEGGTFGVFDGVSEGLFSEIASRGVRSYLKDALADPMINTLSFADARKRMEDELQRANERVLSLTNDQTWKILKEDLEKETGREWMYNEIAEKLSKDELSKRFEQAQNSCVDAGGLGGEKYRAKVFTTGSVVKIWQGEEDGVQKKKAMIANVGDSRSYLLRGGKLTCLTLDDTQLRDVLDDEDAKWVQDIKASQSKKDYEDIPITIKVTTPERLEILNHRFASANYTPFTLGEERKMRVGKLDFSYHTQSFGDEEINPHMDTIEDLQPGDRIIITSDGVHDQLKLPDIERIVNEHPESQEAADALVEQAAKVIGNLIDDTTAVVVNV